MFGLFWLWWLKNSYNFLARRELDIALSWEHLNMALQLPIGNSWIFENYEPPFSDYS
jgi:hypothetical protein